MQIDEEFGILSQPTRVVDLCAAPGSWSQVLADLVVCDGALDVTGLHGLDEYMQSQLIQSAYSFARSSLREGGCFVAKIFCSQEILPLYSQSSYSFSSVFCIKPRSNRVSSMENFVVCLGFKKRDEKLKSIPFMTCGNMDELPDSDMTYSLEDDYTYHEPVQPPLEITN